MVSGPRRVIILVCISGSLAGSCAVGESIKVDFSSQTFDQWLFRTDAHETGGRWDLEGRALRAILPPGKMGRPPLRFFGQFRLVGDFEIIASFEIKKLPRPARPPGNNSVELAIWSPGRYASVFRQAQALVDGRGFFIHRDDTAHDFAAFVPAPEKSGRLGFRRVGDRLAFLYGKSPGPLAEVGSTVLGTEPIDGVVLLGFANNTTDGLDIQFDRIEVVADRIERSLGPPARPKRVWVVVAGGVTLVIVGWSVMRLRRPTSQSVRG